MRTRTMEHKLPSLDSPRIRSITNVVRVYNILVDSVREPLSHAFDLQADFLNDRYRIVMEDARYWLEW